MSTYIHIKYLVILTYSFQMAGILGISLICYPVCIDRHRDFILHMLRYLFFTYIHNNATVTYFLKFMGSFFKFIYSLLLWGLMHFETWAIKTKLCTSSWLCAKMLNELGSIWTCFYILYVILDVAPLHNFLKGFL